MTRLKVVRVYRERDTAYSMGQVIEVSKEQAAFLLADAPGCFELVETESETKAVDGAPVDKMLRKGKTK